MKKLFILLFCGLGPIQIAHGGELIPTLPGPPDINQKSNAQAGGVTNYPKPVEHSATFGASSGIKVNGVGAEVGGSSGDGKSAATGTVNSPIVKVQIEQAGTKGNPNQNTIKTTQGTDNTFKYGSNCSTDGKTCEDSFSLPLGSYEKKDTNTYSTNVNDFNREKNNNPYPFNRAVQPTVTTTHSESYGIEPGVVGKFKHSESTVPDTKSADETRLCEKDPTFCINSTEVRKTETEIAIYKGVSKDGVVAKVQLNNKLKTECFPNKKAFDEQTIIESQNLREETPEARSIDTGIYCTEENVTGAEGSIGYKNKEAGLDANLITLKGNLPYTTQVITPQERAIEDMEHEATLGTMVDFTNKRRLNREEHSADVTNAMRESAARVRAEAEDRARSQQKTAQNNNNSATGVLKSLLGIGTVMTNAIAAQSQYQQPIQYQQTQAITPTIQPQVTAPVKQPQGTILNSRSQEGQNTYVPFVMPIICGEVWKDGRYINHVWVPYC